MRIVIALVVLAFVSGATAASAAKGPPLVAPRVVVQSIQALSSTTPQRFRVTLLIDNINTEPLVMRNLEFKLRLSNEGIIDGATPPMTVEALDQKQLTLELSSEIVSSLSRLLSFVEGPDNLLSYEIYGRVNLQRGLNRELAFGITGRAPLTTTTEH